MCEGPLGRLLPAYIPYSGKILTKSPILKAFGMMLIICSLINDANFWWKVFSMPY
jgi:hypothetical protein